MNSKESTAVGWLKKRGEKREMYNPNESAFWHLKEFQKDLEQAQEMEKEYRTTHIYTEKDMKDMFGIGRAYQSNGEMEYHFSNAIKEFKQPEQ